MSSSGGGRPPARMTISRVKNKTPAEIQITAEQLLKEAHDKAEPINERPKQKISDAEELLEYRFHKRKTFEDVLRRNSHHFSFWLKYAAWEESQLEYDRARSVYERVLEIDPRNPALWTRYAEMEMRCKNVNLARNLWDRACTQLPRVDQFWYKFAYMEEMLGNINGARQIFERWMSWRPPHEAWEAYVAFEIRYKERARARAILRRMVEAAPELPRNWLRLARFEEEGHNYDNCRSVFESAVAYFGDEQVASRVLLGFAKFETRRNEPDRARAIYRYALERLPKSESEAVYKQYISFEKQHGAKATIESVVAEKRRAVYEDEIAANPLNYDVWFDLLGLEENMGDASSIRATYERAVAAKPPAQEKALWRRYIYLWLFYAAYEETSGGRDGGAARAAQVYRTCLDSIPHKKFTFAKVWLAYAKLLIRSGDLATARKTLGYALGTCPKKRLYRGYIELELQLLEFDRARALYAKFLEFRPENVYAWIKYAEMEQMLGDVDRCRAIYELAVEQVLLDMPEILWKSYIDFEVAEQEFDNARTLYRRLLQRTTHVKVWISLAKFELLSVETATPEERLEAARKVFQEGYPVLRDRDASEERVLLLEAWREIEEEFGDEESLKQVKAKLPRVRKRRIGEPGVAPGEEYYAYEFPDDIPEPVQNSLYQAALEWKLNLDRLKQKHGVSAPPKKAEESDDDSSDSGSDDMSSEQESGGEEEESGSSDGSGSEQEDEDDDGDDDEDSNVNMDNEEQHQDEQ